MPCTKGETEGEQGGMYDKVRCLHEWLKLNILVTLVASTCIIDALTMLYRRQRNVQVSKYFEKKINTLSYNKQIDYRNS
jgi:hypothetical protein